MKNSRWWPSVDNHDGAKTAIQEGVGAAIFVAALSVLFSVLAIFKTQILPGPKFSPGALFDAGLFAIVAWRIHRMSRAWAVVGLLLFIGERAYGLYLRPALQPASYIVGFIILLAFINGVRGTFAYHRLPVEEKSVANG